MIDKIFSISYYICILFLLGITIYAFSISILDNNILGTLFWGLSEGVVTFILFLNIKMDTVPRLITDERNVAIQALIVTALVAVAAFTSLTVLILISINIVLSVAVFLLEQKFCEF